MKNFKHKLIISFLLFSFTSHTYSEGSDSNKMVFTRENIANNTQLTPKEAVALMTTLLPLPTGNESIEEISKVVTQSKAEKYEIKTNQIDVWFKQDTYQDGNQENYHFRYFFNDDSFKSGPIRIKQ